MKATSRKRFDEQLRLAAECLKDAANRLETGPTVNAATSRTREQEVCARTVMAMGWICHAIDCSPTAKRAARQRELLVGSVRACLCAMTCIATCSDIQEAVEVAVEHIECARAKVGLAYVCAVV